MKWEFFWHGNLMKALLLGTLATIMMTTLPAREMHLRPGYKFPQVVLPSIADGKPMDLEDHLGKKMMLHLFASW